MIVWMPNVDKMPTLSETKDSMKILFYVFDYIMLEALKEEKEKY